MNFLLHLVNPKMILMTICNKYKESIKNFNNKDWFGNRININNKIEFKKVLIIYKKANYYNFYILFIFDGGLKIFKCFKRMVNT